MADRLREALEQFAAEAAPGLVEEARAEALERAQEMGINWWESDPALSGNAKELEQENRDLRARLERLEKMAGLPAPREGEEVVYESRREEVIEGNGETKVDESERQERVEVEEDDSPRRRRTRRRKGS